MKNIITDNILLGDIYVRAKELHFPTDVPRAVLLVRQVDRADIAVLDALNRLFPDKQKEFVLSISETDIAVIKEIPSTGDTKDGYKIAESIEQTLSKELGIKRSLALAL